jgi:D-alanyl-D-alanine carboxypeptidase/D-alanyl-D-alanine-endopeptidase (penicillin-binding protein 4)
VPTADDPKRGRTLALQEALTRLVHGTVLGRLRVGIRVLDMATGNVLFSRRGSVLMDPASNQKVLATATALLRLGSTWRFRTELSGPPPDGDGTIVGDLVLRGSGDPSLRDAHLDAMAEDLARRGAVRVEGRVLGDPRRIGSDEAFVAGRSPVRVGWSALAHSPGQQELGQRMGRASLGGSRRRNLWRQRQYRQGCARLAGCAD